MDDKGAEVIRQIFKMYDEGLSQSNIVSILNDKKILTGKERKDELKGIDIRQNKKTIWSTAQVSRILRDETYIGTFIFNKYTNFTVGNITRNPKEEWIKFEDNHEAIIDKEMFERIQEKLNSKKYFTKKYLDAPSSILRRKVVCGICNHKMKFDTTRRETKKVQLINVNR